MTADDIPMSGSEQVLLFEQEGEKKYEYVLLDELTSVGMFVILIAFTVALYLWLGTQLN